MTRQIVVNDPLYFLFLMNLFGLTLDDIRIQDDAPEWLKWLVRNK